MGTYTAQNRTAVLTNNGSTADTVTLTMPFSGLIEVLNVDGAGILSFTIQPTNGSLVTAVSGAAETFTVPAALGSNLITPATPVAGQTVLSVVANTATKYQVSIVPST